METSDGFSPAPLAGYLKTSTAKLISWQSRFSVLGKVALMVAQGSTFAHVTFEGEDRGGGINVVSLEVLMIKSLLKFMVLSVQRP